MTDDPVQNVYVRVLEYGRKPRDAKRANELSQAIVALVRAVARPEIQRALIAALVSTGLTPPKSLAAYTDQEIQDELRRRAAATYPEVMQTATRCVERQPKTAPRRNKR